MANKTAPALVLRDGDRERLEAMLHTPTLAAGLAQRARIVLLASDGMANYEIADRVGVSRPTVNLWRARYTERHLMTAITLDSVADCELQLGQHVEALAHYEKVHELYGVLLIAPDIRLVNSLKQLEYAHRELKHEAEATKFAELAKTMKQELERPRPDK